MRRFPWDILLALGIGLGLGLVYAWMISPLKVTDADPGTLRADFKDQYRSAIAAAFAATGNFPRAQARLELLQDPDPAEVLNAQAQRMLARGDSAQMADQVAELAIALEEGPGEAAPPSRPATQAAVAAEPSPTATVPPASPDLTFVMTESASVPLPADTQPAPPAFIPRPTSTPVPTQGAPFRLTGQDELCDPNLPDGLLQVIVLSSSRRQMPGVKINITWEGGSEQFFTGLKPELGTGYADFAMAPDIAYTVQLATGSDIAAGLTAPTCQASGGETFHGGMKLTFQQP